MKFQPNFRLLSLGFSFILLASFAFSQNIINNYSYSFDANAENWSSITIDNAGDWQWVANGKAESGTYWDNRDSIQSKSLGGAMVLDSDDLISSGAGNPNNPYVIALESPDLNFTNSSTVYLRFHQYFRNFEAGCRLEFLDGNGEWTAIPIPLNINVAKNVETGTADYQVFDLSNELGGLQTRIRFVFSGQYYFWILDDIEFYDGFPFPESAPEYVGDSLQLFGKPYETEDSDWPYVPEEVVVQFKLGTPEPIKQDIRDSLGAILIDTCACNRLELWQMGDMVFAGGDTLSNFGGSIGIQERIKGAQASSTIDGVDFNRYNYNQLQNDAGMENLPFFSNPLGSDPDSDNATLVAILDTGIDLFHEDLNAWIYKNNDEPQEGNEMDDDGNCLPDDWFGWNFVEDNNNPNDDHSHGTHVAGIIRQYMADFDPTCNYRILPYKTHDSYGVATLWDVTCATYQAQIDQASVINDSWGFYGNPSIILSNAVDTAALNNIVVVSAAGNDTTDLATLPQYPACFAGDNIITVGSYTIDSADIITDTLLTGFSNFDPLCVDILAPGDSILSTVPGGIYGYKSGTSMAAPAVSAAAIMVYCAGFSDFADIKSNILDCATKNADLMGIVQDGNVLRIGYPCITPVSETNTSELKFRVFPNPLQSDFYVESELSLDQAILNLSSISGQLVFEKRINDWPAYERQRIDISQLPAGIYFLNIRSTSYNWSIKLIKQ